MSDVGYAAALVLAAVFGWAGLAKLRARDATERTFAAFGLAAPRALAVGRPGDELALAAGLVLVPGWPPSPPWPCWWASPPSWSGPCGRRRRGLRVLRHGPAGARVASWSWSATACWPLGAVVAAQASGADVARTSPAVVLVTTAAALAAVVLALCDLYRTTGHLLRIDLGRPG